MGLALAGDGLAALDGRVVAYWRDRAGRWWRGRPRGAVVSACAGQPGEIACGCAPAIAFDSTTSPDDLRQRRTRPSLPAALVSTAPIATAGLRRLPTGSLNIRSPMSHNQVQTARPRHKGCIRPPKVWLSGVAVLPRFFLLVLARCAP